MQERSSPVWEQSSYTMSVIGAVQTVVFNRREWLPDERWDICLANGHEVSYDRDKESSHHEF